VQKASVNFVIYDVSAYGRVELVQRFYGQGRNKFFVILCRHLLCSFAHLFAKFPQPGDNNEVTFPVLE